MSIDFDTAWEASTDEHTFSNSSEFEMWAAAWCAACQREAPLRANLPNAQPCALVSVAWMGRKPVEWLRQPDAEVYREDGVHVANEFHCIEFRAPGGSGQPRPRPEPSNMDGLFSRPARQTRMLVQPAMVGRTRGLSFGRLLGGDAVNEKTARALVYARSGGTCERCGAAPAAEWDHRKNRSQGGLWLPSNGLHLCRNCHAWKTSNPLRATRHGWAVKSWQNPVEVPVRLAAHGLVLLDDLGGFTVALGGAA